MAMDFPNTPAPGDIYAPPGGPSYSWDGVAWTAFASAVAVLTKLELLEADVAKLQSKMKVITELT